MTSADIHALTGAYALDAVAGVERMDFERHLAECESCAQEVRELRDTAARLGLAAAAPPPPMLKNRVMDQIRTMRQQPPDTTVVPLRRRSVTQRLTMVAAAVFFVAAAGLGVVVVQQNSKLDDTTSQLAQMQEILRAPDAKLTTLQDAEGAGGNGTMKVAWSRSQDKVLFVSYDLANAAEGKDYQLWATGDTDQPRSLGLLTDPANGHVMQELGGLGEATGVAISVEPTGGSEQPSDIVMQGLLPTA